MLVIRYIIAILIVGILLLDQRAVAKPLSAAERVTCLDLRFCIDLLRRHDASEFDYAVLALEFQKFGQPGREALFDILESEAGNPDIAKMILTLGPLRNDERLRFEQNWSPETAMRFLPFLGDGNIRARDSILMTLEHSDPTVREGARLALLSQPKNAANFPLKSNVRDAALRALIADPMSAVAPYVERMTVSGAVDPLSSLLSSADPDLVSAAYTTLYRENPAEAFNRLLVEMKTIQTPKQARAMGKMLAGRHVNRADGFYLKFAQDVSADKTLPVPARAVGLHMMLHSKSENPLPILPQRQEAFAFLLRGQSAAFQADYFPALQSRKSNKNLAFAWKIASEEHWPLRSRIVATFKGTEFEAGAIRDLILSDDLPSVKVGLALAKPSQRAAIQSQINHPIGDIANAARRALKLKPLNSNARKVCRIGGFDLADMAAQLPYFESAWFHVANGARMKADRKALAAAHPTAKGWLAAYDLNLLRSKAAVTGGGIVEFDNKTGDFRRVGNFIAPLAILPDRALKLGQTTSNFWVIAQEDGKTGSISAFKVSLITGRETVRRIGILPAGEKAYSVAPNGDLLVTFANRNGKLLQPPIRYKTDGRLSLACASPAEIASPITLN